jgi:hypothetical protein
MRAQELARDIDLLQLRGVRSVLARRWGRVLQFCVADRQPAHEGEPVSILWLAQTVSDLGDIEGGVEIGAQVAR